MKKIIGLIVVIFMIAVGVAFSLIQDTNPLGSWISSTGYAMMDGKAVDVRYIPGGYAFKCAAGAICYEINGPNLTIYDGLGFGNGDLLK